MQVKLDEIHFPTHLRLRSETYGDIESLAGSIARFGQLFPLLVRKSDDLEDSEGKQYILVDGGRRMVALLLNAQMERAAPNVEVGHALVAVQETTEVDDPLYALQLEFHANEDRENFSWKEKADYVKRIHDMTSERYKDDGWSVDHTAAFLNMGKQTVYKYLQLTEDEEILNDERVSGASSFRTAYKKAQIVKEHKRRERAIKVHEEVVKKGDDERLTNTEEYVLKFVANDDCRTWIKQFDADSFSWMHWDPPYGGMQRGGAFSSHEEIDDTPEYAWQLIEEMIPEIYRTLQDGRWLAIWYHPSFYERLKRLLQGHVRDGDKCKYCGKPWSHLSLPDYCSAGQWAFWVNPYPNIWYKQNRQSDGHEIKRFLTNAYECFLFAAKVYSTSDPILQLSNRQNVFVFDSPLKSERRHVMHKPVDMLTDILKCISIPGETGADPSVGSGSILEAAWLSGRRAVGCELSKEYWLGAVEATSQAIKSLGVKHK